MSWDPLHVQRASPFSRSIKAWSVEASSSPPASHLNVQAVLFDRLSGVKDNASSEGTHFLVPWLQKAILYDVRIKPRNISTTTGSKGAFSCTRLAVVLR